MSVLPLKVELDLDGTWTPITTSGPGDSGYVQTPRDPVTIVHGAGDETDQADPAECTLTVDNRDGRFSPRNPLGPWHGLIGRNTPLRVSVDPGPVSLDLPGVGVPRVSTPHVAQLAVTGDLDLRIDLAPDGAGWRHTHLVSKYAATTDGRAWFLVIQDDLTASFSWSPDGDTVIDTLSTAAIDATARRLALRVALSADNGAGGNTVTYWTGPSIDGPWTQLGDPVVTAGVTSVFAAASTPIEIGARSEDLSSHPEAFAGRVFALQLRGGAGAATLVADADFSAAAEEATSFTDSTGIEWTIDAPARLAQTGTRFVGEVAKWPVRWSPEGADVYVQITAAGVLRRLQQGTSPVWSTLRRGVLQLAERVEAYWPAEDGESASAISAGMSGVAAMQVKGAPEYAAYDGIAASAPIPTLNDSEWVGRIPAHEGSGQFQVRFLLHVPEGTTEGDNQSILMITTGGSAAIWHLSLQEPVAFEGALRLEAFDSSGTVSLMVSPDVAFRVTGKDQLVSVELTQNGSNIDWRMSTLEVGTTTGATWSGTLNGHSLGKGETVTFNNGGGLPSDIAIGHITYQSTVTSLFDLGAQVAAYIGETAGRRLERLTTETGIPLRMIGLIDDTTRCGAQRPKALVELLREAAEADGGILADDREALGLVYRTRRSMYNQGPRVTLDYSAAEVMAPMEPVDDDQATRNDVTVTRSGGGSARLELTSGPLSVNDPPAGVGRYDTDLELSLWQDSDTSDQAGWKVFQGTIDEPRLPQVRTELATPAVAGNADVTAALLAADIGDRLHIINTPAWLPPEDIRQIVRGYTETIGTHTRELEFVCAPAAAFDVAEIGIARYSPTAAELALAVDADDTSMSVTTTAGPIWTTEAADLPLDIMIGGERMTVTAIAGTSSPQTFTVGERAVNGIAKSHSAGAAVALADPAHRAL